MIVFADPSSMTITIADKKVETFDFSDLEEISEKLNGRNVIWVTNATKTSGDEIISLLRKYASQSQETASPSPRTGRMLMHSNVENQLIINGPNNFSLIFTNPLDFKDLSTYPSNIFDIVPNLRRAVEMGKVAIIDEADKKAVRAKFAKYVKKQEALRKRKEDQLDSILINSNIRAVDVAMTGGSDVDSIDIENDDDDSSDESNFIKKYKIS